MTAGDASHYDDLYYESHYGRLLSDKEYGRLLGKFYEVHVFSRFCPDAKSVLDYGAGHGYLTSEVEADCYDPSATAKEGLIANERVAFSERDEIPRSKYDVVFSSHALEHSRMPGDELRVIRELLNDRGKLILILPCEKIPGPIAYNRDDNQHFYAWNFQAITNLLLDVGFVVSHQEVFHNPFMLKTLSRINIGFAISLAAHLGKLKRQYPSLLTVCSRVNE